MSGTLLQVQPVLAVQDVRAAAAWYTGRLGFTLDFLAPEHPAYAVLTRDAVELHLQWHDPSEWGDGDRPMLRFLVEDLEALHAEYASKGVFHDRTALRDTPWGTREFAFFDPDQNGLTFYRPR